MSRQNPFERVGETPQQTGGRFERGLEWAAGLFEGEGSVNVDVRLAGTGRLKNDKRYTRVALAMSDEQEVRDFVRIIGVGNVTTHKTRDGFKPMWYWQVSKIEDVESVRNLLWPWLGERRRAAFESALGADTRLAA